jgi:hypothetical protein
VADTSLGKVIRHMRQTLDRQGAGAPGDTELLERVVGQRDMAAFGTAAP